MNSQARREAIIEALERRERLTTNELARDFGVSEMTIRRDLTALAEEGRVKRRHGTAELAHTVGAEPRYAAKQVVNAALKAQIARYAAERFVRDGQILLLEGGTTVTAMVPHLRSRRELTVVTNGLFTTNELSRLLPGSTALCTGGVLRDVSFTFVGPTAEAFFDSFHGNVVFASASGLTLEHGFTDPSPIETAVHRRMNAAADRSIALIDSSKFGVTSLVQVAPPDGFDIVVTDAGAPPEIVAGLRELGVEVHVI
jgi:DeoR/GlpR family transcriptional regulator of sugar metabolism